MASEEDQNKSASVASEPETQLSSVSSELPNTNDIADKLSHSFSSLEESHVDVALPPKVDDSSKDDQSNTPQQTKEQEEETFEEASQKTSQETSQETSQNILPQDISNSAKSSTAAAITTPTDKESTIISPQLDLTENTSDPESKSNFDDNGDISIAENTEDSYDPSMVSFSKYKSDSPAIKDATLSNEPLKTEQTTTKETTNTPSVSKPTSSEVTSSTSSTIASIDTPPSLPKKPELSSPGPGTTLSQQQQGTTSLGSPVDQTKTPKNLARGKSPSNTASGSKRKRDQQSAQQSSESPASAGLARFEEKIKKRDIRSVRYWLAYLRQMENFGQFEHASQAYEKAVTAFPYAADFWIRYIQFELNNSEFQTAEQLFARCLTKIPSVKLWSLYLEYVLRINNLQTGGENARTVIMQAYEFALDHIGIDRDSGPVWAQYIEFIKTKNADTTWEQQQKMDLIRKTYRRAICIPLSNIEVLWHAYNLFENGINKTTARKFLGEKSSTYMNARSASKEMSRLLEGLFREGAPLYNRRRVPEIRETQTRKWLALIEWEKSNPLALENQSDVQERVRYIYKQATTTLWFSADVWFGAADYSLEVCDDMDECIELLTIGIEALPLSFLLTFKLAEVYESRSKITEAKSTYTALIEKLVERCDNFEAQFKEVQEETGLGPSDGSATDSNKTENGAGNSSTDVNSSNIQGSRQSPTPSGSIASDGLSSKPPKDPNQIKVDKFQQQLQMAAKTLTSAYTSYMKVVKRMEGLVQARQVFSECRRLQYATYQIYVASAMMEATNGRPDIATKIFEIGLKRYPSTEYISEYLEFLIYIDKDSTNARALFETSIKKFTFAEAKILYQQFLRYESEFGDLLSLLKLEKRYRSLYPEESVIDMFTDRYDLKPVPSWANLSDSNSSGQQRSGNNKRLTGNGHGNNNNFNSNGGYANSSQPSSMVLSSTGASRGIHSNNFTYEMSDISGEEDDEYDEDDRDNTYFSGYNDGSSMSAGGVNNTMMGQQQQSNNNNNNNNINNNNNNNNRRQNKKARHGGNMNNTNNDDPLNGGGILNNNGIMGGFSNKGNNSNNGNGNTNNNGNKNNNNNNNNIASQGIQGPPGTPDYDGSTISNQVINILKALPPAQAFTLPPFDPVRLVGLLRDINIPDSLLR